MGYQTSCRSPVSLFLFTELNIEIKAHLLVLFQTKTWYLLMKLKAGILAFHHSWTQFKYKPEELKEHAEYFSEHAGIHVMTQITKKPDNSTICFLELLKRIESKNHHRLFWKLTSLQHWSTFPETQLRASVSNLQPLGHSLPSAYLCIKFYWHRATYLHLCTVSSCWNGQFESRATDFLACQEDGMS